MRRITANSSIHLWPLIVKGSLGRRTQYLPWTIRPPSWPSKDNHECLSSQTILDVLGPWLARRQNFERRRGIKYCKARQRSAGSIDLNIIHMDSFTTISNTSDIPTNSDDDGSGNNAYCVVAWAHPTHNNVRLTTLYLFFLDVTQLALFITDAHITFTTLWLALAYMRFEGVFFRATSLRAWDIFIAGFFRSVVVLLLLGFLA